MKMTTRNASHTRNQASVPGQARRAREEGKATISAAVDLETQNAVVSPMATATKETGVPASTWTASAFATRLSPTVALRLMPRALLISPAPAAADGEVDPGATRTSNAGPRHDEFFSVRR